MFADVGNVPAVITKGEGDHAGGWLGQSGLWIFALVIIFFALVFWKRDGNEGYRHPPAETGVNAAAMLAPA
jgi:hypothetical protein